MSLKKDWIVDNVLAIGPYPSQEEVAQLSKEGFRVIVRLTEEERQAYQLSSEWIEGLHFPMPDYGLPSADQIVQWVRNMIFYRDAGIKVYMHCRAGYGRAGTMAAIYLVSTGVSAHRAINLTRARRPGTIETDSQQKIVYFTEEWLTALLNQDDLLWFKARKMIDVLRKKCPWDKIQTHESLVESLMDEAFEVVEAIRSGDLAQLKEELGDLMIQPLIQSQIAYENGNFEINDALQIMLEKLIRRHPHVFGSTTQDTPKAVVHQWADIKKTEKKAGGSYPSPLHEIMEISMEASEEGFEWEKVEDIFCKIFEELEETRLAYNNGDHRSVENELGDLLFAVFNAIRFLKMDPVKVMERGRRKFEIRYRSAIRMMKSEGFNPRELSSKVLNEYWEKAKKFML